MKPFKIFNAVSGNNVFDCYFTNKDNAQKNMHVMHAWNLFAFANSLWLRYCIYYDPAAARTLYYHQQSALQVKSLWHKEPPHLKIIYVTNSTE